MVNLPGCPSNENWIAIYCNIMNCLERPSTQIYKKVHNFSRLILSHLHFLRGWGFWLKIKILTASRLWKSCNVTNFLRKNVNSCENVKFSKISTRKNKYLYAHSYQNLDRIRILIKESVPDNLNKIRSWPFQNPQIPYTRVFSFSF